MSTASADPLEGISPKTTKADLLERLKGLAQQVLDIRKQELTKLQDVERKIRAKIQPGEYTRMKNVIVSCSEQEWHETIDFLENFEDLLPPALGRLHFGAKTLLDRHGKEESAAAGTGES